MDPIKTLLAHPPEFLADEIIKLRDRVAELEADLAKANQRLVTADWDAVIQERERCIKRLLELVPMTAPDLTSDYLREELAK